MYSKYLDVNDELDGINDVGDVSSRIINVFNSGSITDLDPVTDQKLSYDVKKILNQEILVNDTNIKYSSFDFKYQTIYKDEEDNPSFLERVKENSSFVVSYSDGQNVHYIIDKAKGGLALSVLRKINGSDKNKVIQEESFTFQEDFILWILYRFMTSETVLDTESNLMIEQIVGFRGQGEQKQATLSGTGNEVMNLLGTLMFLVEMDSLTQVAVKFDMNNEKYELVFYVNNSKLDIKVENYTGNFLNDSDIKKKSEVLLVTFNALVPNLLNAYKTDNNWTNVGQAGFVRDIVSRSKDRLNNLVQNF